MKNLSPKTITVGLTFLALLLIFPMLVTQIFPLQIMILVFMYAMLGVAWNIMGGYAGMFSFGQAAFFGIGAYTSSFLLMTFHVNPWIGLIAGGIISSLLA